MKVILKLSKDGEVNTNYNFKVYVFFKIYTRNYNFEYFFSYMMNFMDYLADVLRRYCKNFLLK